MNSSIELIVLFIVSLIANLVSAFSGGGAGLLQFPALILLGLPFSVALATHKIASVALGLGAIFRYFSKRKELFHEAKLMLWLLFWGLPGVALGAFWIVQVPEREAEIALGLLTVGLALYNFWRPQLGLENIPQHRQGMAFYFGGLVLFGIGILNGSLTSGTGLFATLWLVTWFGLSYQAAVAYTLIMVGFFWNGSGAVLLAFWSEVAWLWVPILLLASFIGGYLGAHLAILKGSRFIKWTTQSLALAVGLWLIVGI
jgi:uncharacterized membrane protein YfcA